MKRRKKKDMSSTASSVNSEQGKRESALCEMHVTVQKVRPDAQQGVLYNAQHPFFFPTSLGLSG